MNINDWLLVPKLLVFKQILFPHKKQRNYFHYLMKTVFKELFIVPTMAVSTLLC